MDKPVRLSYLETLDRLREVAGDPTMRLDWEHARQRVHGLDTEGARVWTLRFPPVFPPPLASRADRYDAPAHPSETLAAYAARVPATPPPFLLVLIQAGHSALGYFEEGEAVKHKVIKKYMVRGSGKSQVNYLASRGKSKAGSRVRLANTVTFFEDINEKLHEWEVAEKAVRVLVSCAPRMLPLWFGAEPAPPFDRYDPRILKVPLDVNRPDLEELLRVGRMVQQGQWEGTPA